MTKEQIINAYVEMRQTNNTIPDDVLEFMKDAAIHLLNGGWIKFEKGAKVTTPCLCAFDNGAITRWHEDHPFAIMTHFLPYSMPKKDA